MSNGPHRGKLEHKTHNWMCTSHISKTCPAFRRFCVANRKPWAVVKSYIVQPIDHRMTKTKKKHNGSRKNKETGTRKPRKSAEKNQTRRKRGDDRMTAFNKKKEKALAHLDMEARETALKQFGIEDRFEFADHTKIYNAEHGRFHSAPIEMVSVPTGYITPPSSYYHPSDSSYNPPRRLQKCWPGDCVPRNVLAPRTCGAPSNIFRECTPTNWLKLAGKTMACGSCTKNSKARGQRREKREREDRDKDGRRRMHVDPSPACGREMRVRER